ncbi:hypothetical protein chiPu_0024167, partial [Chiloscyllium punctatum]|nr:hypothetical protein [Chiloscyllium punctatum]
MGVGCRGRVFDGRWALGVSDTLSREPRSAQADASYEDGKVTLRPHRKLSSRIYSSENPRQRFRQRRVGWFPTESEDDEAEGVDSSPSCSSTISRDSDPMLDSK